MKGLQNIFALGKKKLCEKTSFIEKEDDELLFDHDEIVKETKDFLRKIV